MHMKDKGAGNYLVWQIAGGIVLATLILGALRTCQEQAAIRQFNDQMQQISAQAATDSRQMQAAAEQRSESLQQQEGMKREAELSAKQLGPDERCIGKQLFTRVENGWVQITDGTGSLKCGR
jgi:hypothetical protein